MSFLFYLRRGTSADSAFIMGTAAMLYYTGSNNMRSSAAYKSYTFNCCWLWVDFPGVRSRAPEGSGEINHGNNEGTLQRKACFRPSKFRRTESESSTCSRVCQGVTAAAPQVQLEATSCWVAAYRSLITVVSTMYSVFTD